jgi:hypothetical protein
MLDHLHWNITLKHADSTFVWYSLLNRPQYRKYSYLNCLHKCLKIPKEQSEAVNRRMTDNTMAKKIIQKQM